MGATHTFSTPSCGAIQPSRDPSWEIRGLVRSGLPNKTLRGMRSTMPNAYHKPRSTRSMANRGPQLRSAIRYTLLA